MNTSKYIQNLEDIYCHSRSAVTSELGLSCGSASLPTRIINGGKKVLYTAAMTGMLFNNTIPAYADDYTVYAGQTSTGLTVGTDPANSVVSTLNNYGTTHSSVINSGGTENIYNGGVALWGTVNVSGVQNIYSGGGVNVTTLSGGQQYVNSGAIAINTHVGSAFIPIGVGSTVRGEQFVLSGGLASDTTLTEGSKQYISNGGSAVGTTITNYGIQDVSSGGYAAETQIDSGYQNVSAGASANSTTINNSGRQWIGGKANSTIVNSGGSQVIATGGSATNTTVNNQGLQYVIGQVVSTWVNSGGVQEIHSGLATSNTIYGSQIVKGSAVNTVLLSGLLATSGGVQHISNGGLAISTTVNKNTAQYISFGGQATSTTVLSSGVQQILLGGTASNTTVYGGGSQIVCGAAIDTTVHGSQYISGGVASNTNLYGRQSMLYSGRAINTNINGGVQTIYNTGSATSTNINSNGIQNISSGGLATSTNINSGTQNVLSGGTVTITIINNGGKQNISNSGIANSTTISAGTQNVSNGGSATSTTIYNAGTQNIYNGGKATSTIINNGGTENISSGGSALFTSNAGHVNLNSGGYISNYTNTATTGILEVKGANILNGTTNLGAGKIVFNHATPTTSTVTVQNLSANGAVVSMGVNLEDQTSDKLLINGTYTGNAALSLTNLATSANETTGTGIKLVDFAGDNTGGGTFSLLGGQWDEGGYVYKLFQDSSDPDYYLRSTQELSDTYKTMLNVPLLNAVIARTGMNSLNKRLGDISLNKGKTGLWLRSYYKDMTVDDLIKTDMSLFGVEAGYDWLFNPNDPTKLYAGIMVGYMQANSIKTKNSNSDNNNGKGDSPSVGVYVTIANEDNWFIDLAARNFWTKVENTTRTSSNNLLNYDVKRNMLAASFEVGKNIATEVDLKLQPKVEISYMKAGKDSSPVTNGVGDLTYDSATYISGKAAILFAYKAEFGNSLIFEPLLELAYNHEFDGEGLVSYGGATEKTSLKGGSGEIIAGFNMQLADNLYWHAIGSYEKGSKISGWGVNAGIRVGFGGNDSGSKKSYKNKKKYQSNPYRYYKTYR